MLPLAFVTAMAIMFAWFPLSTWMHQQAQINATATQIIAIKQQEQALKVEAKSISTKSAATLLARQQYQLVAPGQSLIQVLPGVQPGNVSASSGDPGLQPLVSPSSAPSIVVNPSTSGVKHHTTSGFLSRLVRTLEFWR
jgi:hypothetical protein